MCPDVPQWSASLHPRPCRLQSSVSSSPSMVTMIAWFSWCHRVHSDSQWPVQWCGDVVGGSVSPSFRPFAFKGCCWVVQSPCQAPGHRWRPGLSPCLRWRPRRSLDCQSVVADPTLADFAFFSSHSSQQPLNFGFLHWVQIPGRVLIQDLNFGLICVKATRHRATNKHLYRASDSVNTLFLTLVCHPQTQGGTIWRHTVIRDNVFERQTAQASQSSTSWFYPTDTQKNQRIFRMSCLLPLYSQTRPRPSGSSMCSVSSALCQRSRCSQNARSSPLQISFSPHVYHKVVLSLT